MGVGKIIKAKGKAQDLLKKIKIFFKYIVPAYCNIILLLFIISGLLLVVAKNLAGQNTCPVAQDSLGFNEPGRGGITFTSMTNLIVGVAYDKDGGGFLSKYRNAILNNNTFQASRILILIIYMLLLGSSFVFGLVDLKASDMVGKLLMMAVFIWGTQSGTYEFYDVYLNPLVFQLTDYLTAYFARAAGFIVESREFQLYLESHQDPFAIFDAILIMITSEAMIRKLASLVLGVPLVAFILPLIYLALGYLWFFLVSYAVLVAVAKLSIVLALSMFPIFLPFIMFDIGIKTKVFGVKEKFKSFFDAGVLQPCIYIIISIYVGSFIIALLIDSMYEMLWFPACYVMYFEITSLSWFPGASYFFKFFYWKPGSEVSEVKVLESLIMVVLYIWIFKSSAMEWSKTIADSMSVGYGEGKGAGLASGLHSKLLSGAGGAVSRALFGKPGAGGQRRGGLAGGAKKYGGKAGGAISRAMGKVKDNPIKAVSKGLSSPLRGAMGGASNLAKGMIDGKSVSQRNADRAQYGGFNENYAAKMTSDDKRAHKILDNLRNGNPQDLSRELNQKLREANFSDQYIKDNVSKLANVKDWGDGKYEDLAKRHFGETVLEAGKNADRKAAFEVAKKSFREEELANTKNHLNADKLDSYFESRRDEFLKSDEFKQQNLASTPDNDSNALNIPPPKDEYFSNAYDPNAARGKKPSDPDASSESGSSRGGVNDSSFVNPDPHPDFKVPNTTDPEVPFINPDPHPEFVVPNTVPEPAAPEPAAPEPASPINPDPHPEFVPPNAEPAKPEDESGVTKVTPWKNKNN